MTALHSAVEMKDIFEAFTQHKIYLKILLTLRCSDKHRKLSLPPRIVENETARYVCSVILMRRK